MKLQEKGNTFICPNFSVNRNLNSQSGFQLFKLKSRIPSCTLVKHVGARDHYSKKLVS